MFRVPTAVCKKSQFVQCCEVSVCVRESGRMSPQSRSLEVEQRAPPSLKAGWNSFRKMKLYCRANGTVSYSVGPHWFGAVVTTLTIMFVLTLNRIIIERSICTDTTKDILLYVAIAMCCIGEFFLLCTALVDGGTIVTGPAGDEECASLVGEKGVVPYCDTCMVYQINEGAHCTFCDCCVEELDHHCPWMGKCIGKGNMFWFKCFMATVVLYLVQFFIVGVKYS